MKVCPKCKAEHNLNGVFCSRKCSNSRVFSESTKEKKRNANKAYYSSLTPDEQKKLQESKRLLYDFDEHQRRVQQANLATSWSRPYEEMSIGSLRKRLLVERENKCEDCGCGNVWNGKPISLEMDHIDGNNKNNKIENLRILCPNCHSQTPTHRAKNIKFKRLNKESIP